MPPRVAARAALVCPLLLVLVAIPGCDSSTGPERAGLPGTRVLSTGAFTEWTWVPGDREILYGTPFNYPYTGPPTRLEAVALSGGARRTVAAAPTNGDQIIGYRFLVQGAHVYFEQSYAPDRVALWRAPLTGTGTAEPVLDSIPYGVSVSPDEGVVAWVDMAASGRQVVTIDLATTQVRTYPLSAFADRIHWSPTGKTIALDDSHSWSSAGNPFQSIDLQTGVGQLVLVPGAELTDSATRDFRWEGEVAYLYTTGDGTIARYALDTGAREQLASTPGRAVGWSADFEAVFLATSSCLELSGGGSYCVRLRQSVDRLAWRSGARTNVFHHDGAESITGRPSPGGNWLAYEYWGCSGDCNPADYGVYVVPIP